MKSRILYSFLMILLLQACDFIPASERLVEVEQVPANKTVMVIEFTDQKCVNCPQATDVIEELKATYPGQIVSVSIHSYVTNLPLVTQTGRDYNTLFQPSAFVHPMALIDGSAHSSINTEEWPTLVRDAIQQEADADLTVNCRYDSATQNIICISSIRGIHTITEGKLQLWLTEDSITSYQLMSDGSRNNSYVHNQVFRTTVNGAYGSSFSITPGQVMNDTVSYNLSESTWNLNQLHLVGFIYTGENFNRIINVQKSNIE